MSIRQMRRMDSSVLCSRVGSRGTLLSLILLLVAGALADEKTAALNGGHEGETRVSQL